MKSIFPNKLQQGDIICVIAPASSVAAFKPKSIIKKAVSRLTALGFKTSFGKNIYEKDMLDSSSVASRVADLHAAFKDKKVAGVLCARGGFNSNDLLPYIDWELIKQNPKPLIGYSDITVLANALYAKTGVVTYSGPSFSSLGADEDTKGIMQYTTEYFTKCLSSEKPFEMGNSKNYNERKVPARKNIGVSVLQDGIVEGTIIGGNLCSLNLLQGTGYMPSLKDVILFIEEDDFGGILTPLEFGRNLESLLQLKDADTIKGIVFGRFQKGAGMTIAKMKHILKEKKISKRIPILYNADFGHTAPMFTFPIGGTVRIEAKGKTAKITILKH